MKEISLDFKPQKREDLKIENIEDGSVVYDPLNDEVFLLNNSASVILNMCDGNFTIKEMIDIISETLNVEKEKISQDTIKIINEFIKKNIIKKD
ncbi:MAG: PqqD family peptide modification chaperone [candidate division WOR-3 bacterium]